MKCKEAGSNRIGGVSVHLGKTLAAEYNEHFADDGAMCCYIVAEETDRILLGLEFEGTTTQFYIDVIVDGVFRYCHRSNKTSQPRKYKNQIQGLERFETGFCEDRTGFYPARMTMVALDTAPIPEISGHTGVGSIEFRFSVVRKAEKEHDPYVIGGAYRYDENDKTMFSQCAVEDADCLPTHGVRFAKHVKDQWTPFASTPCSKGDIKRLRKNMKEKRPGPKPWCVFRYYYRSKEVIDNAGWEKCNSWRDPRVLDIEPATHEDLLATCPQESDNISVTSDTLSVPPKKRTKNEDNERLRSPAKARKSIMSPDPRPSSKFKAINSKPTQELDFSDEEQLDGEAQNQNENEDEDEDDNEGEEEPRKKRGTTASMAGPSNNSVITSTFVASSPLSKTVTSGIESPVQAVVASVEPRSVNGHGASEDGLKVKYETKPAKLQTPPISRKETSDKLSTPSPKFKRQLPSELGSPSKRTRATPTSDSLRKLIAEKEKALAEQRAKNRQAHERSQKAQEQLDRKKLEDIERQLEAAKQEEEDYDHEVAECEHEWNQLTDSEMEI